MLDLMLTGRPMDVREADRAGLVSRVCDDTDALLAAADEYAGWFADASPAAVRLGRRAFTLLADLPAAQAMDAAQFLNLTFFLGGDLAEGATAFLDKRAALVGAARRSTMTDAFIVGAVRSPVGKRNGALVRRPPDRPRRPRPQGARGAHRGGPRRDRRRAVGMRRPDGTAGLERRSGHGAVGRLPRVGARHHDRPSVRLVAAGASTSPPRRCSPAPRTSSWRAASR